MATKKEKLPKCKLVGTDGNVFAIIGNVSRVLERAGSRDKAKEFRDKAIKCTSYGDVLCLVSSYVDTC
jgi:hypothetical protein